MLTKDLETMTGKKIKDATLITPRPVIHISASASSMGR